MSLSPRRWKEFVTSRYAHEREALEFLREFLPDRDPNLFYSNFEFIADDGSVNEIDGLVVTQAGVFLLELKSRGGVVTGNRHLWAWEKNGNTVTVDSPLTLINSKARKLAGLLARQPAFRGDRPPRIEALVFLSAPGISVRLPESERMRICEREPREKRPGILPALLQRDFFGNESARGPMLGVAAARILAKALDEAGIRPLQRQRSVGDYVLQDLIEENPLFAYQDFQAQHPTTKVARRVRIYTVTGKDKATHESVRRAAIQEFEILESLDHPGILRALDFTEHELGPAILFRRELSEVRLDHYLRQHGGDLSLDVRLDLVRQIADAVRHAHDHRVVHRTLSPKSILVVNPDTKHPEIRIFNWQASRTLTSSSHPGSLTPHTSTLHPSQYSEESALVYLAPESLLDARGRDPMADVFSLGAIACAIFSGRPPAANVTELNQVLVEHKGLPLAAVLDGASSMLQELIRDATNPDMSLRTATAADFLAGLDLVEEELTSPPKEQCADPVHAKPEEILQHSLKVLRRLGSGSHAVALLVQRNDEVVVLKCAREAKDNDRIEREYRVLRDLRHELIVSPKGELLSFAEGNVGFLMDFAGEWISPKDTGGRTQAGRDTLARELKMGRLSLDFLERFGDDLLRVVQYLEEMGVSHRDLKPENIGIKEYAKKLHLRVFDFSLSGAPLDQVRVGTPPYLEPFLQLRKRWDTAAERYSAAVILYEMATGITPRWGDGQSAPHLIEAEVTIEAELFDAPVREELNQFFRRCFKRDPLLRFDNATEMLLAWRFVFQQAAISDSRVTDSDAQQKALDNLRPETLVAQLGLSTRSQNTLDRLGIFSAQDLALESPGKFMHLRGVGNKTRREIIDLVGKLRAKLPQSAIPARSSIAAESVSSVPVEVPSVDALTASLLPSESSPSGKVGRKILSTFLELDIPLTGPPKYPTQSQVAQQLGKTRAQVGQIVVAARERWRRSVPALTVIRTETAEFLAAEGGVAQISELAQFLLASRGSEAAEPLATQRAAAVVRAALEAEKASGLESVRFEERRHGDVFLVALAAAPYGEVALDYAIALGEVARNLAATDPLPSPVRVIEMLRVVPSAIPALRNDRMVRVAAAAAEVAVSPRLEIYPRRLEALRALKLAQSAAAGIAEISAEDLRARVRERYPEAELLPGRPALDQLLIDAGLGLTWNEGVGKYLAPREATIESSTNIQRHHTLTPTRATHGPWSNLAPAMELPPEIESAIDFERRLQVAYSSPSFFVLATKPKLECLNLVLKSVQKHFPMAIFNGDKEFLTALREEAVSKGIDWSVILRTDASRLEAPDPSSTHANRNWDRLVILAKAAAGHIAEQLRSRTQPTLILYPGLLARYGQLSILEGLADDLGDHSLWLLVGSEHQVASPLVDGQAIPARPSQWGWIPPKWLDNEFRTTRRRPLA